MLVTDSQTEICECHCYPSKVVSAPCSPIYACCGHPPYFFLSTCCCHLFTAQTPEYQYCLLSEHCAESDLNGQRWRTGSAGSRIQAKLVLLGNPWMEQTRAQCSVCSWQGTIFLFLLCLELRVTVLPLLIFSQVIRSDSVSLLLVVTA